MRFALLGTEKDGIDLASALVATGRHQLLWVSPPSPSRQWPEGVKSTQDSEEVLAEFPAADAEERRYVRR